MAPEWLRLNEPAFSVKSDIFAFGVVVWEVFVGARTDKKPWQKLTHGALVRAVKTGKRLELNVPAQELQRNEKRAMPVPLSNFVSEQLWAHRARNRPTFTAVCEQFKSLILIEDPLFHFASEDDDAKLDFDNWCKTPLLASVTATPDSETGTEPDHGPTTTPVQQRLRPQLHYYATPNFS